MNSLVSDGKDDKEASEIGDFVPSYDNGYQRVLNEMSDLSLLKLLSDNLNKREYYVLYHRFISDEGKTLEEIGDVLGLTRERVRQIESKALKRVKILIKKPRPDVRSIKREDILPISFKSVIILKYLKEKLNPYEYYIFYNILYKNMNMNFVFNNMSDIKKTYLDIVKRYDKVLYDNETFNKIRDEIQTNIPNSKVFDLDIEPIKTLQFKLINDVNKMSYNEIRKVLGENYDFLDQKRLIDEYFNYSFVSIIPSQLDQVLKVLNLHYYGIGRKKKNIPLDILYNLFQNNKDKIKPEVYNYMEGTIFSSFTNKNVAKDSRMENNLEYTLYRLEAIYYNVDNYFKYEIPAEEVLEIIHNEKNKIPQRAIDILTLRYIKNKTIAEIAELYGEDYLKMHDYIRISYDRVVNIALNRTINVNIANEDRYKEYILNPKYAMTKETREVCRLFFIEHKSYKEISAILGIKTPERISNILTDGIRRMDLQFYNINSNTYTREELIELFKDPNLPISDYEKDILCSINGINTEVLSIDEVALKYNYTKKSIQRRIIRAFLSLKKYENNEIAKKINYEVDVIPYMCYFPLFEQNILIKRYKMNMTAIEIGKEYNLSKEASFDLIDRIEKRFAYIQKYPNAKKFDFDYARTVLKNDDLPFYGDKDKAVVLYTRQFGDDGKYPQTRKELMEEFNLSESAPISIYIKSLMVAVFKYRDGIRKNKNFTVEEIREFYQENKDKYSKTDQKHFETTLSKMEEKKMLSMSDYQNNFVNYELMKNRGLVHFMADTSIDEIKNIIRDNPYHLTHSHLEVLRNYYKIPKREFMSGKDKNKVFKLIMPYILEYDNRMKKMRTEAEDAGKELADKVNSSEIILREDIDNNVKIFMPNLVRKLKEDKVLVLTEDLDYVFAYIYNLVKNIDIKSNSQLLKMLYDLKSYLIANQDRLKYKEIFQGKIDANILEQFKDMDPKLKAFWMELIRLGNSNCVFDQNMPENEYARKNFVSNYTYYPKLGIRMKDTNVSFIDEVNDYYREINIGKNIQNLSIAEAFEYVNYCNEHLINEGSLVSYFNNDETWKIDEIFKNFKVDKIKVISPYDKNEKENILVLAEKK